MAASALPTETMTWESVPGVILNNGTDAFRLEITVNRPVRTVELQVWTPLIADSGQGVVALHDDGQNGDRTAGDWVFTSELLRFDTRQQWQHPANYQHDTNSPAHVSMQWVGSLSIQDTNGGALGFAVSPQVGILSSDVPLTPRQLLASNVAVAGHLINVQTSERLTQQYIRLISSGLYGVTATIYSVFPDAFDFLMFFSSDHVEYVPYTATPNFNAGIHHTVKVNYTGTGQTAHNESGLWGNPGRLLGINIVDSYERGMMGYNATHEILHQWSSYTATTLSDGSHYVPRSSVASLLGGYLWQSNGNGGYTIICEEGREGATHAAALDKYMMGLIPGSAVPEQRVYLSSAPTPYGLCNQPVPSIESTVSIATIQSKHGVRSPGPATVSRDFSIGFVVESHRRLLNPVEMTFYEIFAAHYTKPVPAGHADPYVGGNWPPIERYFGENTRWRSDVLTLIQPVITSFVKLPDGRMSLTGTAYPGKRYSLLSSTNLIHWSSLTNTTATTAGTFNMTIVRSNAVDSTFYRLALP